jgi:hypothetical protein
MQMPCQMNGTAALDANDPSRHGGLRKSPLAFADYEKRKIIR